jgi:hypothetical protein
MEKDAVLEFYPEILLHVFPKSTKQELHQNNRSVTIPSQNSLKMYTTARFFKRKYHKNLSSTLKDIKFKRIILIKKFTGLKRFRRGIKLKIRSLPSLVLDGFFLCQIIIVSKKELDNIFREILETSK